MASIKILCLIVLFNFLVETETASCCLSYTKHPRRCAFLKGYDIQGITGSCDIRAIIFHTKTGKTICADPSQNWTLERVKCLKIRAEQLKIKGIF